MKRSITSAAARPTARKSAARKPVSLKDLKPRATSDKLQRVIGGLTKQKGLS